MNAWPLLPGDFAQRLLSAEMELEQEVKSETVDRLVDLYRQAIEYYECWGDSSFLDYQARLHQLLLKPGLLQHLSPTVSLPSPLHSPHRARTPKSALLPSLHPSDQELSCEMPIKQSRKLQLIVESQRQESSTACSKAKQDVANQYSTLTSRLAKRKTHSHQTSLDSGTRDWKKKVSDSVKSSPQHISESDKSGGTSKRAERIDTVAHQIEEVLERLCTEYASKAAAIRLRYETQIQAIEQDLNGSTFMQKVVDNMRMAEETEINDLQRILAAERKEQLAALGIS